MIPTDVYSRGIQLEDLEVLTQSPRNSGEDDVQTYYGWREARAMSVAKGFGSGALALLTAWITGFLKGDYARQNVWLVVLPPLLTVVFMALVAWTSVMRMDRIHASFVKAIVWLRILK